MTTIDALVEMFVASFPEAAAAVVFAFTTVVFVSALVSAGIVGLFVALGASRVAWDGPHWDF
jgi:hypothetical protein